MDINIKGLFAELERYKDAFSNKNGFLRNTFTLTMGTTIAQAIPVLFSPLLARLFTPREFGLLAILTSITAIINVISTGKYETAVLIADTKKDAANIIGLSLALSFLLTLITLLLFSLFPTALVTILKQPRLEYWIFICPILSFLIAVYQCYNEWCVRNSQFVKLSVNKVINSGSITGSNLIFGLLRVTSGGLILGELLGRSVSAASCIVSAFRKDSASFLSISWKHMSILARRYISCPKFVMPGQLVNTVAGQISILMIAAFFSEVEVGFYSMTVMVLTVPASLVSLAIRDVFRQRANEDYKTSGNCVPVYKKTITIVSVISVFIFTVLYFIIPDLISFFLGPQWRIAGEYARILCPTVMISFVAECVWGMFIIAEKMRAVLIWQSGFLFFTVFSLFIGYYFFRDMKNALICFTIGRSIIYLISIKMTYEFAKGK